MHCLLCAEKVYSVEKAMYRYRMHGESAVHTLTLEKIQDVLSVCVRLYRLYPNPVFANYYCMNILKIANLSGENAAQLKNFLRENSDILQHTSGRKTRIARTVYKMFGWYRGARMISYGVDLKHRLKEK